MKNNVEIPESLKNYTKTALYLREAYRSGILSDTAKALTTSGAQVKIDSKRLTATIGTLANRGVIDLKPLFRNSPKAKQKKNGGWYLIIPMSISSRDLQKTSGRKTYDAIREAFSSLGPNEEATLNFDGLFSRSYTPDTLSPLVPPAPSGSLTAIKSDSGKRTSYIAYRTVSDKSSPQSWVINRKNVNDNNTSQRLEHEVGVLIRKRMREYRSNK